MKPLNRLSSRLGGRRTVLLLGGLYTGFGVLWPVVWVGSTLEVAEAVIIATLVGSAGLILLYGGHRLPRSDIHPTQYPVVATWCLRAIGVIGVILLGITLTGQQTDPAHNFLILSALAAVAGFGAGSHDARAKTRAFVLEQRNMELEETQAKLEETVERLEASEQRYRTLAENFPNGTVALLDADLRYILVAGQGFDAVSYDADEIQGQSIEDAYPQAVVDDVEPHYRRTLAGEPTVFETTVEGHTFEVHLHPLTDDSGDVYAVLAMSQDVTDRNARERELATRVDQQRLVADLGQLALETDDLDELMAEATQQVTDVLDIEYCKVLDLRQSEDELLLRQGVGWDAGLVGEATVSAIEADSQAAYTLESEQPVVVADLETETRFGGPDLLRNHDVRSGISTSIGPADDPWGILGAHDTDPRVFSEEDVTFIQTVANVLAEAIERHQYQRDLERSVTNLQESNERLEQFAYAASHDLQEPLRMVSSYLKLIETRYGEELDEDGEEFLGYAIDGSERMRAMIDGLLSYARVETQGEPLEPTDLDEVFADVREDLHVQIDDVDARVTSDSLPVVEGDANQLRRVFQNLLQNSIRYSDDEPPSIHVSADRSNSTWTVTVRDDGIGMDPEETEQIFDVFSRLHPREEYAGSGVGLAVCERIVERHGGDIWAESEPGEGTAVSFTLNPAETDS